ncbi:MAG: hypothetical protein HC804_11835, partial [Anaerolineae bacterium]|nr:hypothetical protein [Anaerolineae bacterium]
RMQQAADAMRRAAGGSAAQGKAALEELNRAAKGLEQGRSDGVSEGIKRLADRASDLRDKQEEIESGVKDLPGAGDAGRAEALRRLDERKKTLSEEVSRLEAEADRLGREARREQPEASRGLSEASETMRAQRLRDRIEYSRGVIRGGSSEYAGKLPGNGLCASKSSDQRNKRGKPNGPDEGRGQFTSQQRLP